MEEELRSKGLKPNTIELLKDQGFETWDDLEMLDVADIRGLSLPLQQTLMLQKIMNDSRVPPENEMYSVPYSSSRRSSGVFYQPEQFDGEYINYDTHASAFDRPNCRRGSYIESRATPDFPENISHISRFSETAQPLLVPSMSTNSESTVCGPESVDYNEDTHENTSTRTPIYRPVSHYNTLPTNTSKSEWGMGHDQKPAEKSFPQEKAKTWSTRSFNHEDEIEGVEIPISIYSTPNISDPFDLSFYKSRDVPTTEPLPHTPIPDNYAAENLDILSEEDLRVRREKFRKSCLSPNKSDKSDEQREKEAEEEISPSSQNKETDFSSWLNDTEAHTSTDEGNVHIEDLDSPEGSEISPRDTNLLRNRYGSSKSLDSNRSTYSGYFANTDPNYVNTFIDQIRPNSKNKSRIPAVIIDLSEVECMHVEEGCLYLTPKNSEIRMSSSAKSGMSDFGPLLNLMSRRKSYDSNYSEDQNQYSETPGSTYRSSDSQYMPHTSGRSSPRHFVHRPTTPMSERVYELKNNARNSTEYYSVPGSRIQHQTL